MFNFFFFKRFGKWQQQGLAALIQEQWRRNKGILPSTTGKKRVGNPNLSPRTVIAYANTAMLAYFSLGF